MSSKQVVAASCEREIKLLRSMLVEYDQVQAELQATKEKLVKAEAKMKSTQALLIRCRQSMLEAKADRERLYQLVVELQDLRNFRDAAHFQAALEQFGRPSFGLKGWTEGTRSRQVAEDHSSALRDLSLAQKKCR